MANQKEKARGGKERQRHEKHHGKKKRHAEGTPQRHAVIRVPSLGQKAKNRGSHAHAKKNQGR